MSINPIVFIPCQYFALEKPLVYNACSLSIPCVSTSPRGEKRTSPARTRITSLNSTIHEQTSTR